MVRGRTEINIDKQVARAKTLQSLEEVGVLPTAPGPGSQLVQAAGIDFDNGNIAIDPLCQPSGLTIEQGAVQDGLVLSGIRVSFVGDFSDVDSVCQEL